MKKSGDHLIKIGWFGSRRINFGQLQGGIAPGDSDKTGAAAMPVPYQLLQSTIAKEKMTNLNYALQHLPDIPCWVEARALLLEETCEIFGLREELPLSLVIRDTDTGSVFIAGDPDTSDIRKAVQGIKGGDIIAPCGWESWLVNELSGWVCSQIMVYRLPGIDFLPDISAGATGFIDAGPLVKRISDELYQELLAAAQHSPIAAAFASNGQPVSFSYAGAVTETLWDISIDTLPEYRRQGYAALAVTHMIHHMHAQGRQPVWMAVEENPASWRLAEKLGFDMVDRMVMLVRG